MSELDWEIRPYEDDDAANVRSLLTAAFPTETEADLVEALRSDGDAEIELVADADGTIVGHILLSKMQEPAATLGLAPVATLPAHQRQGIAASLIESGLAQGLANDWKGAFVLGDLSYYGRFGFEADAAKPFESPYAGEHFGFVILDDEDDQPVTGDRANYAKAFSAL